MALLKLLLTTCGKIDVGFNIVLKTLPEEEIVLERDILPDRTVKIPVSCRRYQLEIANNAGLSPERIVKYFDFSRQSRCGFNPVYNEMPPKDNIELTALARDKYYENIIPINGGITVCPKITP